MAGRLLQWLGAIALLGAILGVGVGLWELDGRVQIVLQPATEPGPDPAALLRDEVQQLTLRVDELQRALGSNFEQLATGLQQQADQRHRDLRSEFEQLRAREDERSRQLAAVRTALAELARPSTDPAPTSPAMIAAVPAPAAPESAAPESAASPEAPAPPSVAPIAGPQPTAPTAAASGAEPAGPQPAPGFLSFRLPSQPFDFRAENTYRLVPKLSRVGFDAKSTLHDFTGATQAVDGGFTVDFDDPAGACRGEIRVDVAGLTTGIDGRDANMREHLAAAEHPTITFTLQRFDADPAAMAMAAGRAGGEVAGTIAIRGVTRPFRMPVAIEVDAQQRLLVTGSAPLWLSDFAVPVPNQLGVVRMQDEVRVWIALRARADARRQQ